MIRRRRFGFSAAQVERNCSRAPLLARPSANLRANSAALVEADLAAGDRRPEALLVLVEVLRVDPLPLALDDGEPAGDVGRDRNEPRDRRELAAGAALLPAARGGRDARALAVEVGVEEGVQRDRRARCASDAFGTKSTTMPASLRGWMRMMRPIRCW